MRGHFKSLASAVALVLAGTAQAALIDRGGGMIYDSARDLTWLQDAKPGMGSSFDNGAFTSDGRMSWANATGWADQLDYRGYDDWRLPAAGGCFGDECPTGEIGGLWYIEFGYDWKYGSGDQTPEGAANMALFFNWTDFSYWTSTVVPFGHFEYGCPGGPGVTTCPVMFQTGYYSVDPKREAVAWAVRVGDVAPIPEPETYALMLAGLAAVGVAARRRKPRSDHPNEQERTLSCHSRHARRLHR